MIELILDSLKKEFNDLQLFFYDFLLILTLTLLKQSLKSKLLHNSKTLASCPIHV